MAHLNPLSAANDFLDYLSLAPVEELRQLAQKTINLYTAQVAFKHFIRYPISINHPKSQILFLGAKIEARPWTSLRQENMTRRLGEKKTVLDMLSSSHNQFSIMVTNKNAKC